MSKFSDRLPRLLLPTFLMGGTLRRVRILTRAFRRAQDDRLAYA